MENFKEQSQKWLWRFLAVLSYGISAVFTIRLFVSAAYGWDDQWLNGLMAFVMETSKVGLFVAGIAYKHINKFLRGTFILVSLVLTISSMFASSAHVLNTNNKQQNESIRTSAEYKQLGEGRNIQQDLYNTKKQELNALQKSKEATTSLLTKNRDERTPTFKDKLDRAAYYAGATNEIVAKEKEYNDKISAKSAEISALASSLSSPINVSNISDLSEAGYNSIFGFTNEMSGNKLPKSKIAVLFFIFFGNIFEIVAACVSILSYSFKPKNPISNKIDKGSAAPREKKKAELIFEQHSPTLSGNLKGIKQEDIKEYIKYMFDTAQESNGQLISKGYKHIAQAIGLSTQEEARKIRNFLERSNVLLVEGKRTIISKNKEEILSAI